MGFALSCFSRLKSHPYPVGEFCFLVLRDRNIEFCCERLCFFIFIRTTEHRPVTWYRFDHLYDNIFFFMVPQRYLKGRLICVRGDFFPVCLLPASYDIKGVSQLYPDLFIFRGMIYRVFPTN